MHNLEEKFILPRELQRKSIRPMQDNLVGIKIRYKHNDEVNLILSISHGGIQVRSPVDQMPCCGNKFTGP